MNGRIFFVCLLSLSLIFSPLGSITQISSAAADLPETNAGLPDDQEDQSDIDSGWWAAAQKSIRQGEYAVTWQTQTYLGDLSAAYQAPNRAQNLRTYFTPQGIRLISRLFEDEAPPWEWGLSLTAYSAASEVQPVAPPVLAAEANRITYQRDNLTEWYLNTENGLAQGFILDRTPVSSRASDILLELAIRGDLNPGLSGDGRSLEFTTPGGVRVLRYGDLRVTDAAGRALPARFALSSEKDESVQIVLDGAGAAYPITVGALVSSPDWSAEGDQDDAWFGFSVGAAGDVNGDGYDDVIIGAPNYDNGQPSEGRAYVFHGGPSGLSASPNWHAESDQEYVYLGFSVAVAGDVNNDGYADVIVGAPFYNNGQYLGGRAYVFHGSASGLATSPNWMVDGDQHLAELGWSVNTAGDVNSDGFDDVIIGALGYDNGETDEGCVFVYYGTAAGLSPNPAWMAEGDQVNPWFGAAVGTAGDVNGDGYSDVIVGAPMYLNPNYNMGRVFVYHGGPLGLSASADWEVERNQLGSFGRTAGTAGDVNGDGYSDIIVGAGYGLEGQAYVYLGSPAGLDADPIWSVGCEQADARFAYSVSTAGDMNGDGYDDIIVGATYYDNGQVDEGAAFVYHGGALGPSLSPDWTAESDQSDAHMGWSVSAAGDVNGDGYGDIIIGAPYYDNDQTDEGRGFVYYGSRTPLTTTSDWTAEGDQADAGFGWAVSTAGDVNGDGYSDIIIGAPDYDRGFPDEGRAFVFCGSPSGLVGSASWTAESDQGGARFGYAVGMAGDVNGDGFSDIVIGAPFFDGSETDEGRAYGYYGSLTGLSEDPDWVTDGGQAGAWFSVSVDTAGDVNGDEFTDVIIGAPHYSNGQVEEGRALVYHGSATGLSAAASWMGESDQSGAQMGWAVSAAGDVDGDGYGDVIVGAPYYTNGQGNEGLASVYQGGSAGLSQTAAWSAESDQDGAHLGASVDTAGDVNGDGYSDVIIGAPDLDGGETDEGQAAVYYGGAFGLAGTAAWTAEGSQSGAGFGAAVKLAGDVNGDGYSDVIVGAPYYDNCYVDEGRAALYRGSSTGLSIYPDWMAESSQANAQYGISVGTAGDVNGDGYSDVIVGAYRYDHGQMDEGQVYAYYGGPAKMGTEPDWAAEGDQLGAYFGYSVGTAGDVNGDGFSDVIVGAYCYDNGQTCEGLAYLYYGSSTGLATDPAWMAEGDQDSAYFGQSVGTAGDVNGDGYSDVIVGADRYDNGGTDEGRAYVYYGSPDGLATAPAWTAENDQDGARFGRSVGSAGDINGDGYSDVIVGAYGYDNGQVDEGRAFVFHGSAEGLSIDPDWMAEVDQAGAQFGYSVGSAGDINGDGYSDVIVGAYGYDNGQGDEGRAFVYQGSEHGLSSSPIWTAESNQAGAWFGCSVGTAGDVNGDGYSDVIIGARYFHNGQSGEGRAFVYHGSQGGLETVPAWIGESNKANASFGRSVGSAGDVNGDGYSDVIIGAPDYNYGDVYEGRVYIYPGGPVGLNASPMWTADGNQGDAAFGISVGRAGDVNGDGFSDIIIGAPYYDNGQINEGGAFVFYGDGGNGFHLLPRQLRSGGGAPIDRLGMSDSRNTVRLSLIGHIPSGRQDVRLQWQIAPLGVSITSTGVMSGTSGWIDVLTGGVEITQTVTGLKPGTPYHWRVRLLYEPGNALGQSAGRWLTIPWSGWNETDLRTPTLPNQPPVADAGPDQSVDTLTPVTLDGTGSSDPDEDLPLAYHWTQTGGPGVVLSDPMSITPIFTAMDDPGVLTFTLAVTDSLGLPCLMTDEVVVTVINQSPVADAGTDRMVETLAQVTLDGSGSMDPDGDLPLAYLWMQTGGPGVILSDRAAVTPTFTAPDDPGVLTFTLAVTDSLGLPDLTPDEVLVRVGNDPPVADAGPDQDVDTLVLVTLDGTGSSDPDGDLPLAYLWTQTGGSTVTLSDSSAAMPTFMVPAGSESLTFTLIVTDSRGLASLPDTVTITVEQLRRLLLPVLLR